MRQDIGTDPSNPYLEGSPLTMRVPVAIDGLPDDAELTGYTAVWRLFPYEGFGVGDAVLEKSSAGGGIANSGDEFVVAIEQGETTGMRHMHRHELWIQQGATTWPVLTGDFRITPSPMAPGIGG